jgi:hypothetical protein
MKFGIKCARVLIVSGALFLTACPAHSQEKGETRGEAREPLFIEKISPSEADDTVGLLGLTLNDLLTNYNAPGRVQAVRGKAPWQDDVAFIYEGITLYVAQNRVWQLSSNEAFGVRVGDKKDVALLTLGSPETNAPDHVIFSISDRPWPVKVRYGVDTKGSINSIYIYRSDF